MLKKWLDKLLSIFFREPATVPDPSPVPSPELPVKGEPKWLELARADLGIKEFAGAAANPAIMRAWQFCDYDPPPSDETAWCSAKMNEWTQKAGLPGTRQPNARSWAKYGKAIDKPVPGCITVFWRGSPTSWEGHVALYIGPGDSPGTIKVLGGNQGNSVCIAEYPVERLICYRMPVTGANSRTLKANAAGAFGDFVTMAALSGGAILEAAPDALAFSEGVQALATYWPALAACGLVLSLLTRAMIVFARLQTFQEKGA